MINILNISDEYDYKWYRYVKTKKIFICGTAEHAECNFFLFANSADPDQNAPKEQSDQGLHSLLFIYPVNLNCQIDKRINPKIL